MTAVSIPRRWVMFAIATALLYLVVQANQRVAGNPLPGQELSPAEMESAFGANTPHTCTKAGTVCAIGFNPDGKAKWHNNPPTCTTDGDCTVDNPDNFAYPYRYCDHGPATQYTCS